MSKNVKSIAVLTSGGDAQGMNACIRAVVRTGIFHEMKVYGVIDGFHGLIHNDFREMDYGSVSNIIQRGGTILGTARSEEFREKKFREIAYKNLKAKNIDTIVVIGGDGSYAGARIFFEEFGINFIGIPGTIDNDIEGSNYSLGFDTALNNIVEAVDKIRDTASSHRRIFLIEVMGNKSGVLALNAALTTGAEEVFIPETKEDYTRFENKIKLAMEAKKSSIFIVSEGDEIGGAHELYEYLLKKNLTEKIRVSILGHLQRGGNPSYKDRMMATQFGARAVEMILNNQINRVIGTKDGNIYDYVMHETIAKKIPKYFTSLDLIHKLSVF